jgi:type I restriction enzyme R subunit
MSNLTRNQTPEQKARDQIDRQLAAADWLVQDKKAINNLQANFKVDTE